MHWAGDHLAQERAVDRGKFASVDRGVHPLSHGGHPGVEHPGQRAQGSVVTSGLDGPFEGAPKRCFEAGRKGNQKIHQISAYVAGVCNRGKAFGIPQQRLGDQLLAIRPVTVNAGLVHACRRGNILIPEPGDAITRHEFCGGGEDLRLDPRTTAAGTPRWRRVGSPLPHHHPHLLPC